MDEQNNLTSKQPHVLIFPYPIQGHINPMIQFSKRLASKGVKITLITTFTLAKSLPPQSTFNPIQIQPIFDGYENPNNIENYLNTFQRVMPLSLGALIEDYKKSNQPLKYIIYDAVLPWVLDLAWKAGIDGAPFFTQSGAVHSIHYHVYEGSLTSPTKGSFVSIPGTQMLIRVDNEMPSILVNPSPYLALNSLNINQSINFHKANLLFINTIDVLEDQLINWMTNQWPIKTIGPTIPSMYLDKRLADDKEYGLTLFEPDFDKCIEWLNTKDKASVVYIAMGSLASLGEKQMEELAKGLQKCGKYFLWVVRALEESKLPPNTKHMISEKGLVVNWSPQLAVLDHPTVGCFMTHCGWNSTLEAISLGVPLVAMPQWTDQPTNAKYIADVWRIGVRVKVDDMGIVTSEEIEACIREVMDGDRAVEIRRNLGKLKLQVRKAMEDGGSSDKNIDEFVGKLSNM